MDLSDTLKVLFIETAQTLKGSARRLFMARTVKELGPGGQRRAERELGWKGETRRKGSRELAHGIVCLDNYAARGRKRAEDHLPNLLCDMAAIVDSQSQADPQFRTNRLYTRLDAAEVRRQLIAQKGYKVAREANERLAHQRGVRRVVLPQAGRTTAPRQAYERQRWFRRGRDWRAGIEGRISGLSRRHKLERCRYHGEAGMQRWVGWGIITHNLHSIAQALIDGKKPLTVHTCFT